MKKTKSEIIASLKETLTTAKFGLDIIETNNPKSRQIGLKNLFVFGRAVTNVLQNLRSVVEDFDEWYFPYQEKMKNDKIMKAIYQMRSEILKEGKLKVGNLTHIKHFSSDMMNKFPKPPNAKAFFMGDRLGGNGWEIELPDGTIEKYYIDLPADIGYSTLTINLENGETVDILKYSRIYYQFLQEMVNEATNKFKN